MGKKASKYTRGPSSKSLDIKNLMILIRGSLFLFIWIACWDGENKLCELETVLIRAASVIQPQLANRAFPLLLSLKQKHFFQRIYQKDEETNSYCRLCIVDARSLKPERAKGWLYFSVAFKVLNNKLFFVPSQAFFINLWRKLMKIDKYAWFQ